MSSNQAYYVRGWVIGAIAIAYLKLRDSHFITPSQQHQILPWIADVAHMSMDYYDRKDTRNDHLYWAGVEIASAGIAANDRTLFDWDVHAYHMGVDQIQSDGTLPLEMRRGRRALHYHLDALSPLVYLAEFGKYNGLPLYAADNYALKRLVDVCTHGLIDNSLFEKRTGIPQDIPNGPPAAEQISWARIWVSRFHDPALAGLLAEAPSLSYMYLGGLPPRAHK